MQHVDKLLQAGKIDNLQQVCGVLAVDKSTVVLHISEDGCETRWTDCIVDKILKKVEIGKLIATALKSILN